MGVLIYKQPYIGMLSYVITDGLKSLRTSLRKIRGKLIKSIALLKNWSQIRCLGGLRLGLTGWGLKRRVLIISIAIKHHCMYI